MEKFNFLFYLFKELKKNSLKTLFNADTDFTPFTALGSCRNPLHCANGISYANISSLYMYKKCYSYFYEEFTKMRKILVQTSVINFFWFVLAIFSYVFSWRGFVPLSKLSYCVYMLHNIPHFVWAASSRSPVHIDPLELVSVRKHLDSNVCIC